MGCNVPKGDDNSLIEKMHKAFGEGKKKNPFYGRIRKYPNVFQINHYAGPVTYTIDGTLGKNRDKIHDSLAMFVQKCGTVLIQQLFAEKEKKDEGSSSSKGRKRKRKKKKKRKDIGRSVPSFLTEFIQ